ncbi:hypothetical protein [Streptomyces goshikiensis]|uniref:hypothetical protein n=1 Tax=Streptomyces goshikiensis TaxID=1942 RepID=UPI0036486509
MQTVLLLDVDDVHPHQGVNGAGTALGRQHPFQLPPQRPRRIMQPHPHRREKEPTRVPTLLPGSQ